MGSDTPYRIDLLDRDVDSIRRFDPDTQRSLRQAGSHSAAAGARDTAEPGRGARIPPPLPAALHRRSVGAGGLPRRERRASRPGGIEFFLPLFFERTSHLFEYLPPDSILVDMQRCRLGACERLWNGIVERHEQLRHDRHRPILDPAGAVSDARGIPARSSPRGRRFSCTPSNGRPRPPGPLQNFPSVGAGRGAHRSARRAAGGGIGGAHQREPGAHAARRRIRRPPRTAARSAARPRRSGQDLRQLRELPRRAT